MADNPPMQILIADDLTLLPQLEAHAPEMFGVLADPAIYTFENEAPVSIAWLADRFRRLEARCSPDGSEQWLNWVIQNADGHLIGYVQATVRADGAAYIAYVLGSANWGKGLARRAVDAMIAELVDKRGVVALWAIFKERNVRSRRLLERVGFTEAAPELYEGHSVDPDETLMVRRVEQS